MECLGQARKRCSNRWCCGPRNYVCKRRSADRPILAAGVESPSQTQSPGVVFCTARSRRVVIGLLCFLFSSHPFWTSSSLDVPAGVTQEEGHTGFLIHLPSAVRALIFVARRIQPFLSLVDREVEFCVLTLCTNELIVLHPLGIFILVF